MSHAVITKIERQKKARHRVSIYLDGEFAFGANDEVIYRFGLVKGKEMPPEFQKEIKDYDAHIQAKLTSVRYIASRIRSEKELRIHLQKKGYTKSTIDDVIENLRRINLLDDQKFAEAFVKDRLAFKPRARNVLHRELIIKGISDVVANRTLDMFFSDETEFNTALKLAETYLRKQACHPQAVGKRRLYAFLQRKGYRTGMIREIIDGLGLYAEEELL